MKLRNKFLIIFFILALTLCLALVSSASDYFDLTFDPTLTYTTSFCFNDYDAFNKVEFDSSLDFNIGIAEILNWSFVCGYGFINIDSWHYLFLLYDITCADDLVEFATYGVNNGFWPGTEVQSLYIILKYNSQSLWNTYQKWLNNDYFYTLVDCQNIHVFNSTTSSFIYNNKTYNSVISHFCPRCELTKVELSSDILVFLDDFISTASDEELLTFNFYEAMRLYILEAEGADVENLQVLDDFVDRLEELYITKSHEFVSDWLGNNDILSEPLNSTGKLDSLQSLLENNVLVALQNKYNQGYNVGYNIASDEVYPLAFADGVNASITRMEDWLTGKNLLKQTTYKDGDLVSINQVMNNNVVLALDERQALGYELGAADGQALGNTEMYNLFIQEINHIYGTEYSLSEGIDEPDLTVLNTLYAKAYEAGELYQLNKMTDDGGISDFLADISGTVLSTFFYIATNISFMGTSALSLISLFVIAVIVIFILKFVIKS